MIKWVKFFFWLCLVIIALVFGYTFASQNTLSVSVIFFDYSLTELSLGMWVLIALLVGGFLGLLLSYLPLLWGRKSNAAKIYQLEKELDQLRAVSLKG